MVRKQPELIHSRTVSQLDTETYASVKPPTQEAEIGDENLSLLVWDHHRQHAETVFQKKSTPTKTNC